MSRDEEKIRRLRKELAGELVMLRGRTNMTQEQLANLVGINSVTLRYWEIGKYIPSAPKLQMLIETFVREGFFSQGKELEEIRNLWNKAREAGLRGTLDEEWLTALQRKYSLQTTEYHQSDDGRPEKQESAESSSQSTFGLDIDASSRFDAMWKELILHIGKLSLKDGSPPYARQNP